MNRFNENYWYEVETVLRDKYLDSQCHAV